jgi:hypothetical protein
MATPRNVALSLFLLLTIGACAAQPRPVAYSITVISASIPAEKAPGVKWDKPEKDKGFLSGACKAATIAGAALAGGAGKDDIGKVGIGIASLLSPVCDQLDQKADPSAPLPDPYVEIFSEDYKIIIPPQGNTLSPVWEQTVEIPYKKKLVLRVHLFDNDGKTGEAIGSGSFEPGKQSDAPFEVECGNAKIMILVKPRYPEPDKGDRETGGQSPSQEEK